MIRKHSSQGFYTNIKRKLHQKIFLSIPYTNQTFSSPKIILQTGAPSWRNVYQVVSQLNPWIGSFFQHQILSDV